MGRLEKWVHGNLTSFSKAKAKVLHLGLVMAWGNPQHPYIQTPQFTEPSYPPADWHSHPAWCCLQLTKGALNPPIQVTDKDTEQGQPQFWALGNPTNDQRPAGLTPFTITLLARIHNTAAKYWDKRWMYYTAIDYIHIWLIYEFIYKFSASAITGFKQVSMNCYQKILNVSQRPKSL